MVQLRMAGRNVASVLSLLALFLYVAYFTSELYSRLNSIQKLQRLHEYERELEELSHLLHQYKADSKVVKESISLLQEVVSKMADFSKRKRAQKLLASYSHGIRRETKDITDSHHASFSIRNHSKANIPHHSDQTGGKLKLDENFVYHPEQILQRDQSIRKPKQLRDARETNSVEENSVR